MVGSRSKAPLFVLVAPGANQQRSNNCKKRLERFFGCALMKTILIDMAAAVAGTLLLMAPFAVAYFQMVP